MEPYDYSLRLSCKWTHFVPFLVPFTVLVNAMDKSCSVLFLIDLQGCHQSGLIFSLCYHKTLCPNNDLSLNLKPDIIYTQSVDLVLQQKL